MKKVWTNFSDPFRGAAKNLTQFKNNFDYPYLVEPFLQIILADLSKKPYNEEDLIEYLADIAIVLLLMSQFFYEQFETKLKELS